MYEVELLRFLDHPNIVKVYEFFQDSDRIYIVTEFCNGGELYDVINQRKSNGAFFSEKEAGRIIEQVLSAINYCH